MKNVLVTGGTAFVSRYVAAYFVGKGDFVYTLNRNNGAQPVGVSLIQADRNHLGDELKKYHFDVVLDMVAYTARDVNLLLDALGSYGEYVLMSSSAVYPEDGVQPFAEETPLGFNTFWGSYGTDKIAAEEALQRRNSKGYILRPPYLYGPMNNVYREAFVFDCALKERTFYLPQYGHMKLQFFHINDLCRFINAILEKKPEQRIFNVGNREAISILDWATLCYKIAGTRFKCIHVPEGIEQRNYFSFYNYEYFVDTQKQDSLLTKLKPIETGLKEFFEWYMAHPEWVKKKPFIEYIDQNLVHRL